jgi:DNA-binding CsgD family transcriptional regulator
MEVLRLIVAELDCRNIARHMCISVHTVQAHRRNIFRKTKAKSIIGLVKYALRNKIATC